MYTAYLGWLEDTYGMTEWRKKVVQADAVVMSFTEALLKETVMGVVDTAKFAFHLAVDPEKTTREVLDQANYLINHPEVLVEAAKTVYHNFEEGTPEERAAMLGSVASILVPGLSVTKSGKVGQVLDGVQDLTDKAVEGVKDLGKVLKNSEKFPGLNPFVTTPEGFTINFNAGKIPETNPLPKTSVQEHYMSEMDGLGDGKAGKIEGTGEGRKLELSDFTKEVMETKPMNSPVPKKWYDKGGTITIDENGTWTYTNRNGISVSYPNGYPDFSQYYHPSVEPVTIKVSSPKNNHKDFENANKEAGLSKDSDPPVPSKNEPPEGYTWHHHEDGETMVLVEEDIHDEFKHIGGQSKVNGKNKNKDSEE